MNPAAQATAPPGYHGSYLAVDVTSPEACGHAIPPQVLAEYLGGVGLGSWLMLKLGADQTDPLSPEAPLALVFSPLVGSPLTTSAKFAVVSRSPLTGYLNDSLASSRFALAGKQTGHDAIVIRGRAVSPSILVIEEGEARLDDASDLWGLSCQQSEALLRKRYPAPAAYAVIGPAGEKQVRYATLSHDGRHAGRGGSGAVLGAKNIKAVVVSGNRHVQWYDTPGLVELARDLSARSLGPATAKYRELGTAANLVLFNRLHALPTRNFQQGSFEGVEALSPQQLAAAREKTQTSCAACTIGCTHIYGMPSGSEGADGVRIEYESLFALGPLCGIGDQAAVLEASQLCDELGIDTISAGGTIAFAMECVERGILDEPWLRFGDPSALLRALKLVGRREGLGDRLAEGSKRLALQLGQDSLDFAPQVKGLEIPGYEPRALQAMALGFAVGSRGADHNRSGAYEADFSEDLDRREGSAESAQRAVETEDRAAIMDSMILCKFLRGALPDFFSEAASMLATVTGWQIGPDQLELIAKRIVTARKLFNIRCGWTPSEDVLPLRFLESALPDDPAARLRPEQLQSMIEAYNRKRGWQADGTPSESSLTQYPS